jgi:hypothetical protein
MIISERRGNFVSQREQPAMALIEATFSDDLQKLRIKVPTAEKAIELDVKQPSYPRIDTVTLWKEEYNAVDQGDEVAKYLTDFLKYSVRLVRTPEGFKREPALEFSDSTFNQVVTATHHQGDTSVPKPILSVYYPDAFPFLLITEQSMAAVNDKVQTTLGQSIDKIRFRPNIVINGTTTPFVEDTWKSINIVNKDSNTTDVFYGAGPCPRCTIPNVNPEQGKKDVDVRGVLNTFRRDARNGEPLFGVYLICTKNNGTIRVGDEVIPGEAKPNPALMQEQEYKQ